MSTYDQRLISEGEQYILYVEKVTGNVTDRKNEIYNLEQLNSKKGIIEFLHTALFSPVKSTWLRAIRRNHFITWPGINSHDVTKYLQPTTTTAKGHLDRKKKNINSTNNNNNLANDNIAPHDDDVAPHPEEKSEHIFIAFLLADTQGTVYTDLRENSL